MFRRLRNRLLLLNMAMISLVMIAALVVIYMITYTNIQKENKDKLESIPTFSNVAQLGQGETRIIMPRLPVDFTLSFSVLVDSLGQVMDTFSYIDMPPEVHQQIARVAWDSGRPEGTVSVEGRQWQYRISSVRARMLVRDEEQITVPEQFQIGFMDITDSRNTLTQLLVTFMLVGVAMLFILFGVSLHFANRSIQPLEANWEKQKQFVVDASHELKTPLAIINANTAALLSNEQESVISQVKWINYIQSETRRMSRLVNDMLFLARVEEAQEDQTTFEMSETVMNGLATIEAVIYEKGISLSQSVEPGIWVKGNPEYIMQAVLIFLDNAVKYNRPNGAIDVSLRRCRNQAVFSVQNTGKGIPPDQLPMVFERFYRGDASRSQEVSGHGLGLSIAKATIDRSGGSIHAESSDGRTTFSFSLKTV